MGLYRGVAPHGSTLTSAECMSLACIPMHTISPLLLQEPLTDHTNALDYVLDYLKRQYSNTIKDEVKALGHRVVHGKHLSEPMLVDEEVMRIIREAADLAPLHNPANLQGIVAASAVFTGAPQVTPCTLHAPAHLVTTLMSCGAHCMMRFFRSQPGEDVEHFCYALSVSLSYSSCSILHQMLSYGAVSIISNFTTLHSTPGLKDVRGAESWRMQSRWLSLTQHSTRRCRHRPTCMQCHTSTMKSTMCASMASMGRPSNI